MMLSVLNDIATSEIQEEVERPIAAAGRAVASLLNRGGLSAIRETRLSECLQHLNQAAIEAQYAYHEEPK